MKGDFTTLFSNRTFTPEFVTTKTKRRGQVCFSKKMRHGNSKGFYLDERQPTVAVFSHPNHELAVFGLIQRLRPNIIFLTNGGGPERILETQEGLRSIGVLDQAVFLNHTEGAFYDSLLACDDRFYNDVADQVHTLLDSLRPAQILCDAVEFYNPVHDLSLPIVQAALRTDLYASVFEVPLVFQKSEAEEYEVQRLPLSRHAEQIEIQLTEEELDKKLNARDLIYTSLQAQMGTLLSQLPSVHIGSEVVAPATFSLQQSRTDRVLRYEWRANLLSSHGKIDRVITYSQHYLPIASALLQSDGQMA